MEEEATTTTKSQPKGSTSLTSLYANNVRFEPTFWDLKLVFSQLDASDQDAIIIQPHTAISLAWAEAKVAAFLLLLQVEAYEADNGRIHLAPRVIPRRPDSSDPSISGAAAKKLLEYAAWVHDQFFGDNPYIPPAVAALDTPSGETP
jgi:hypothetical protein